MVKLIIPYDADIIPKGIKLYNFGFTRHPSKVDIHKPAYNLYFEVSVEDASYLLISNEHFQLYNEKDILYPYVTTDFEERQMESSGIEVMSWLK
jgi:hypothetical protein